MQRLMIAAAAAGMLLAAQVATAQSTTLQACVNPSSGELRMTKGGQCPPHDQLVEWNIQGPPGPQGPAGPEGPAGSATSPGGLQVVDSLGQPVGTAIDPLNGLVARNVGGDWLLFLAPAAGFAPAPINFFHSAVDCSDSRYLLTTPTQGLVYFALVHGSTLFYTRTVDPLMQISVPIHAFEQVGAGQDANLLGTCTPFEGATRSMGVVTAVTDPAFGALAPPFRIQ